MIMAKPGSHPESPSTSTSDDGTIVHRSVENDPPDLLAIPTPFPLGIPLGQGQGQPPPAGVAPELIIGTFQLIRMPMAAGAVLPAGLPEFPALTGLPSIPAARPI